MLSALIMVISHPPVAEEQVGAVHLPNLLKIKMRSVSSPEAGVGGTWRPRLVSSEAHATASVGTASKGLLGLGFCTLLCAMPRPDLPAPAPRPPAANCSPYPPLCSLPMPRKSTHSWPHRFFYLLIVVKYTSHDIYPCNHLL